MRRISGPLLCAAIAFGFLGSAKGLEEGLIATTVNLSSFIKEYGLDSSSLSASEAASRLSTITSMVHLGSLPGAWIAYISSDRIGPLWTMRELCMLWIVGVAIVITSAGSRAQLIGGRFVIGMGIGQTNVIAPIYLAEVAPVDKRGLLVGLFSVSEYVGIVIGYFAGYGSSIHQSDGNSRQWIIPQSIQIVVSGVLLLFSLGCVNTPRYLCQIQRPDKATHALAELRGLSSDAPEIAEEMQSIQDHLVFTQQSRTKSFLMPWRLLFGQAANRSRMLLLLSAQLLSQWSGTNAITTYAPKFFSLLGLAGTSEELLSTGIFGIVKLLAAVVCAIFFIDRIGRKRSLASGIVIHFLSLLYIAIYLTIVSGNMSQSPAAVVAIAAVYLTGIGYAFGWNCMQFLINAEMLPGSVREIGSAILMCVHYAVRFAVTKAVPNMLLGDALQPKGTFWFFAAVALLGLLWTSLFLPETSRRQLEETSENFSSV